MATDSWQRTLAARLPPGAVIRGIVGGVVLVAAVGVGRRGVVTAVVLPVRTASDMVGIGRFQYGFDHGLPMSCRAHSV